jgi:uncharacterized protein
MPVMEQPKRKPPRPKARAVTPALEGAGAGVRVTLGASAVVALPEGALWLEQHQTLVVSDLHLEKGSAFARRGQMLPPYDTRVTLSRIAALITAHAPKTVISLGDSFHDREAAARLDEEDVATISKFTSGCDWVWIEGNHDPLPPAHLGGRAAAELEVGDLIFRHESTPDAGPGEISGHLHPCAKVSARGGAVRRRCFATDGVRLVMPAFGAYTGGLNVCDDAFAPVFPRGCFALVLGKTRVYPTPPERLTPDA